MRTAHSSTTAARSISREGGAKALFVLAAGVSFVLSITLWFGGHEQQGIFVGLWVPSILSLGAVVLAGRDRG